MEQYVNGQEHSQHHHSIRNLEGSLSKTYMEIFSVRNPLRSNLIVAPSKYLISKINVGGGTLYNYVVYRYAEETL